MELSHNEREVMESVKQYADRHRVSSQVVRNWIKDPDKKLITNKIGKTYVLLGLQARPVPKGRSKAKPKTFGKLMQFSKQGEFIQEFNTIVEASEAVGTSKPNISMAVNKVGKTAGGYVWKRENKEKDVKKIK